MKGIRVVKAFFSNDPWAFLTLLNISNGTPIPHEPNTKRPVTMNTPWGPQPAYIVSGPGVITKPQQRKDRSGEPLGPEDYELGLKVPPAEVPDETLETALAADAGFTRDGHLL